MAGASAVRPPSSSTLHPPPRTARAAECGAEVEVEGGVWSLERFD